MSHIAGFAPYGKPGTGNYGSTLGKLHITYVNPVKDRILELAKSIPFRDKSSVFSIGDYGTADGSCSMPFIRDLIVTLREHHGSEVQFQVIYEDKEINDFNSLFKRLMGIIPDPPTYMFELDNVYPLASGINFYKQCVPSDSMHFIMSMIAVQWLSKPIIYKTSLWFFPDTTDKEQETLTKQIQMDWESFLLHRSRELKHGGILLVSVTGQYINDNGMLQCTGKTLMLILTDVWRSFRDSGKITTEEFTNTNCTACAFTLQQLSSPFDDDNTKVFQSGLHLLSAELIRVKCVFYSAWQEKKELTGVDDRQEFARSYVTAHRSWSNNMFMFGLSENRTQEVKKKIVDELFYIVEKTIAQMNPMEFTNDTVYAYVVIRKE